MSRRFIRYMAATDASPAGLLALEYLRSLLRIAPVRVGSLTCGTAGRWEAYEALLSTPMDGEFINVVCCSPSRWIWTQHITMYDRRTDGTITPVRDSGQQELYTHGVRNVLLTDETPMLSSEVMTALRYQCVVVPDALSLTRWSEIRNRNVAADPYRTLPSSSSWDATPTVIVPVPVTDHATLRSAIIT